MWSFIRKMVMFRLGQKSARAAAVMLGFGRLGMIAGLIGGLRAVRRHRHA